jgi:hypothetical protein
MIKIEFDRLTVVEVTDQTIRVGEGALSVVRVEFVSYSMGEVHDFFELIVVFTMYKPRNQLT